METLCTVICIAKEDGDAEDTVQFAIPLRDALSTADRCHLYKNYKHIRVYAETNNGAILTLIYQPT